MNNKTLIKDLDGTIISRLALSLVDLTPTFTLENKNYKVLLRHDNIHEDGITRIIKVAEIPHTDEILNMLQETYDALNTVATKGNSYLKSMGDQGQASHIDDKLNLIPFTRGQVTGALVGRDRVEKIIKFWKKYE